MSGICRQKDLCASELFMNTHKHNVRNLDRSVSPASAMRAALLPRKRFAKLAGCELERYAKISNGSTAAWVASVNTSLIENGLLCVTFDGAQVDYC